MDWTFSMVIHTEFGGFHLTDEIVRRLTERGCDWISECVKSGETAPMWFLPYRNGSDDLRKDEDLVAVVQELSEECDSKAKDLDTWRERAELRRDVLGNLKVVQVHIAIEIEEHDGKETVRVTGGTW